MRLCATLLVLAACAGEPSVPQGYVPLLQGDWSLAPGEEGYYCVRTTATEDMYIRGFRPIAPLGTHHTALAYDLQGGEDGTFRCDAASVGFKLIFGSGVGTAPFELPEGVAFKLPAGEQILLNLHLYNTGDATLTGTSGVEIELMQPTEVVHEAEVIYAIDFDVKVPPGASETAGTCTLDGDSTIFGTFPHMHKLGSHMTGALGGLTFHDEPYNFETQLNYRVGPIDALRGDKIQYTCGYNNPTSSTVVFGDSTDDEMCVLGMYRYPARGAISLCIN